MPDERDYTYEFIEGVRLRVRFVHDRGLVVTFLVQLESLLDDTWQPVLRYDTAHGRPHMDILDRSGRQISKRWLHEANAEAFTGAIADIKANWPQYIERFMKDDW